MSHDAKLHKYQHFVYSLCLTYGTDSDLMKLLIANKSNNRSFIYTVRIHIL